MDRKLLKLLLGQPLSAFTAIPLFYDIFQGIRKIISPPTQGAFHRAAAYEANWETISGV